MTDLATQLAEARERIRQLEDMVGLNDPAPGWLDLTRHQARMLGVLMRRPLASLDMLADAMEASADGNSIVVQIGRLRAKLKPYGVAVRSRYGEGYWIADEEKARLRALVGSADAIAA